MAIVKEKESAEPLPSPELPSPEPMLSGPPPGEEPLKPVVDPTVSPPPGEEGLTPVVNPNVTPPFGAEPIAPVVDPNVAPPPGVNPLKPTPSLEPDVESTSPSDPEEENTLGQPNQSSGPKATQSCPPGT